MLAAQLQMFYAVWLKIRSSTIENIRLNKQKLVSVVRDVRISRIVGASTTLVGGVMTIVGFGLTPVTLGVSTVLGGVGIGVAVVGGITSVGATVVGKVIEKSGLKRINELLVIDQQMSRMIQECINAIETEADRLMELNENTVKPEVLYGMLRAGEAFLRTGAKGIAMNGAISVDSGVSVTVGMTSSESVINSQTVMEVIFLPISVIDLAVTAHGLAKQKNSSALQEVDELVHELENNCDLIQKYMTTAEQRQHQAEREGSVRVVETLITSTRI